VKILYVEDNEDLRETIGLLLAGTEREVVAVGSAEQALEAIERARFDVLVTDVSLPGLSGTDLARQLLARDPLAWVVLCSGYELRSGLPHLGRNVRALTKPFEIEELEALMDEIAAAGRPPDA
jgi:two-component system cell cycle response regulator CpdR